MKDLWSLTTHSIFYVESPWFALGSPFVFVLSLSLGVRKDRRPAQLLLDIPLLLLSAVLLPPPSPGAPKDSRVVSVSGVAVSPLSLEDKWHCLHGQGRNHIKLHHPQQLMSQLLTSTSQPISHEASKMNCISNFCHKWLGYEKRQMVAGEKRGWHWLWPSAQWQGWCVTMFTHSQQGGG